MAKLKKKTESQRKFTKGYEPFHSSYSNLRTRASLASCFSCKHFYQAEEDDCELCQNPDVLKYDMVVTGNRVFCNFWRGVWEDDKYFD